MKQRTEKVRRQSRRHSTEADEYGSEGAGRPWCIKAPVLLKLRAMGTRAPAGRVVQGHPRELERRLREVETGWGIVMYPLLWLLL
jgi:hypothetical protein